MTDWISVTQQRQHHHKGQNGSCTHVDPLAVLLVGLEGTDVLSRGASCIFLFPFICVNVLK